MKQSIANIAILVPDYDEAIAYYRDILGFSLSEDTDLGAGKRWVRVTPPKGETSLLLARASNEEQHAAIGQQAGGRVFLFLHSDDFWRDYHAYQARGVNFAEAPREEAYATVVVFTDLYGNRWDLLQPACPKRSV
ncbi:VOC family protein [Craterilacuibacter sp.]|uniref:VOC family protein n=1 Tax=Craterilacuibacter sp. TaxID=2870909 RepID=UPI003F3FBEB5